mmetsp:Transcript_6414/g.19401  ORF Transcript_6414/g.19401 Transcript_6414/m.19401 type:complete len:407 (+) Transcript_6414:79-1299(+)
MLSHAQSWASMRCIRLGWQWKFRRLVSTLKTQEAPLNAGGSLQIRLGPSYGVRVQQQPLDHWDRISVVTEAKDTLNKSAEESAAKLVPRVLVDSKRNFVRLEAPGTENCDSRKANEDGSDAPACAVNLTVCIPGKVNLDLEAGAIRLEEKVEAESVRLDSPRGAIQANKLRALHIFLRGRRIKVKQIQGNLLLLGKSGSVDVNLLQGPSCQMVCDDSNLKVESLYSDHAVVELDRSNVVLDSVHGALSMRAKSSSVSISGVEGRLEVDSDDEVTANLSRPDVAIFRSRALSLGISPDCSAQLSCNSRELDISSNVNFEETCTEDDRRSGRLQGSSPAQDVRGTKGMQEPLIVVDTPEGMFKVDEVAWKTGMPFFSASAPTKDTRRLDRAERVRLASKPPPEGLSSC